MADEVRREVLALDTSRRDAPQAMLRYRCGDLGTEIEVSVTAGGEPLPLDGLAVTLVGECPAGLMRSPMAAEGSRATYTVGPPLTSAPGLVRPYVELSRGGVLVATTGRFQVRVDPAADAPLAELVRYRSELDGLIDEARALNERFEGELVEAAARVDAAIADLRLAAESGELDGATFTPSVDAGGTLSWTNDRGLPNPPPVNVRGPKGDDGESKLVGSLPTMTEADIDGLFK